MDPALFLQTESLVRDIVIQFGELRSVDTVEKRKELIKKLESLIRYLTPPDNTPKPQSSVNYII